VALAVALAGCQPATSDWPRVETPVSAPDFALPQLDGGTVRLSELTGRVVIMEFWATWCQPCRYSTPSLDVIYRQFKDQGVMVLLINQGEDPETVREWVDGRFEAPILLDRNKAVSYQYRLTGVPTLFVLDRDGNIIYLRGGYRGGLERNLKAILRDELSS